nr:reverse transcriptase domain-containing protein [Tanacetum cinerariifolium]
MPFGIKNVGATYQRLVDLMFQSQIGRNLEAYVDDMLIKSNDERMLLADIVETLDNLRRINMKLNLKKFTFGMEEGIATLVTRLVIISECLRLEKKQMLEQKEEELVCKKQRVLAPERSQAVAKQVAVWLKPGIFQPIRNLEAYVDDMLIKSNDERTLLADIVETLDNLRRINMKLNLKKFAFGMKEGKFLGYMVTSEGIRANRKKTKALADMQSPKTLKELQSLKESSILKSGHKRIPLNRKKGKIMAGALHNHDIERCEKKLCTDGETGTIIVTHITEAKKMDTNLESTCASRVRTFILFPIDKPGNNASYSASLFVLLKFRWRAYLYYAPLGPMSTRRALKPLLFDAPSVRSVQEHLLGVPIQEDLTALRNRVDIVEVENASLCAMIRTMEAIKTITHNHDRLARIEIEH